MSIKNISAALTVIARQTVNEFIAHADVDAFGAPGECHDLVARGEAKRSRLVRRRVHGLTQLPWRVFVRRLKREHKLSLSHHDRQWDRVLTKTAERSGYPF